MRQPRRERRSRSIHQIIRLTVLGGFLVCALIGFFVIEALSSAYNTEFSQHQGEVQEQCFAQVEDSLQDAEWLSGQFIASEPIQSSLKIISQSEGQALANARTELRSAISFTAGSAPGYMRNIIFTDLKGYSYSYGGIVNKMQVLDDVAALFESTPTDGTAAWFGLNSGGTEYMVLTRAIRESKQLSLQVIGYEAVCIDVRTMLSRIDIPPYAMLDRTEIFMDGIRLYKGEGCPNAELMDGAKRILRTGGKNYFVTGKTFFDGRVKMVNYTQYDRIIHTLTGIRLGVLLSMGLLFTLITVISLRAIDGIFSRLDRLTDTVERVDENNLHVTLERELLSSPDEVGILARHLQKMMDRIDTLVNQRLRRQLYTAQTHNRMLQAQIHPHFLYNTLETIHALAKRSSNEEISRISISLSRLVRASFRGSMYAPLSEEIAFVQEYLTIYRIRFGDRLSAVIDYDADDADILLPQMTLQPLVENSVRYGLMKKQSKGVIRMKIRHKDGRLRITLFDNGTGFPQDLIRRYEQEAPMGELESHGYGNVISRLRFTYGEGAVVRVRSREGCWTNLYISIPDRLTQQNQAERMEDHAQDSAGG